MYKYAWRDQLHQSDREEQGHTPSFIIIKKAKYAKLNILSK